MFEARYRRLLKCCQESNGCFALASYGVGITVMLDRVQLEEDSSNSVSIRGGRRFVVQEGSAKVMPGSFGLTVVEPRYIYVRHPCMCSEIMESCPSCLLFRSLEKIHTSVLQIHACNLFVSAHDV